MASTQDYSASIGNIQLDNLSDTETSYPVILAPKPLGPASDGAHWPLKDVATLQALVHSFDPRVLQLDVFARRLTNRRTCDN